MKESNRKSFKASRQWYLSSTLENAFHFRRFSSFLVYVILWWMDWLVFHLTFMWQIGSPSNDRHSIILYACSKKYSSWLSAFEKLSEQCIVIDTYYGNIRKLCIGVLSRKHELGAKSKVTVTSDVSFVTRDNHLYTAVLLYFVFPRAQQVVAVNRKQWIFGILLWSTIFSEDMLLSSPH